MKIAITTTPLIIMIIAFIWTNWLINSRIKSKADRKKYKKFFNERLSIFFQPFFILTFLIGIALFPKPDSWVTFGIIMFCLKFILMIIQGLLSIHYFKDIIFSYKLLLYGTIDEIINDMEKNIKTQG
jgi:hypothetical protein